MTLEMGEDRRHLSGVNILDEPLIVFFKRTHTLCTGYRLLCVLLAHVQLLCEERDTDA